MTVPAGTGGARPQLDGFASVRRWLDSPGLSSAPACERAGLLDLLVGLCEFTGKEPDALVAECLRTTTSGDTAISAKGRRRAEENIEGYVGSLGLAGHEALVAANRLRGFLIHNGIFMQGPASIS